MFKTFVIFFSFVLSIGAYANNDSIKQDLRQFVRPKTVPFPENNPYTLEKAALGKMLFFDQRLSKAQNMSCASCHNPSFGWEVPFPKAIGGQNVSLPRHANTVLNLAWGTSFFWDGRAKTLEEQAKGPIENPLEMNNTMEMVVARLNQIEEYRHWFNKAFPGDGITEETALKAIATYERTLVSGEAPFDKWVSGDETAISDAAKAGFRIFTGKGKCVACHTGWNFTDNQFHDIGFSDGDEGRFAITADKSSRFAFKTPGLRNISQRAPYMHDGSLPDLESVIAHYISGGIKRSTLSKKMEPIDLSNEEIQNLVMFLKTLTGRDKVVALPILPN